MLYLHNILNGVWLMDKSVAVNYLPIISNWIKGNSIQPQKSNHNTFTFAVPSSSGYNISEYGAEIRPENAPENSVAIINITGAITKYDQDCGPAGMKTKSDILNRCYANDNIKGIILDIDSGGGEAQAMFLMQEAISLRNKPVVSFIDGISCSAAYGISCACDLVVSSNNTFYIGSIGAYVTIADFSKYYEKNGIILQDVYATKSIDKNKEYREAVAGNPEPLRKNCDHINEMFISSVAKYREGKINSDQSLWGTGKTFFPGEAKQLGLIDEIDQFENVLNYFNL